ncbi:MULTISPECIES: MFS transporter [Glutamicibacter]|uniref:MFS transporter n=1 Tax=Glutamicibacter arilaitensis TaxID=256701 RepID=A0A2N7S0V2_9MICC|nr:MULTISPECIES: MFS transporter [Glutamicibacter]PMQ19769.1 MFS transporter [Glutamicibacter arilaitensis]HCJ54337.1 MFS transporter [Glutamicibacter sp.]HCM96060.1 MFS transporter [Glutamicibacter sp.]
MSNTLTARRLALCALFLLPGLAMSSWVTRTPAIRDLLGASTAQMGLVIFGLALGAMVGILGSGPLLARLGAKPLIAFGTLGVAVSVPLIALGAAAQIDGVVIAALGLFGLSMGGSEIAMNVEGADVEAITGRPFLPALHGSFSLGTLIGAILGIVATAADFSVIVHLLTVGLCGVLILIVCIRFLPPATGRRQKPKSPVYRAERAVWRDSSVWFIGVIVLAMAFAEGTANDWLPLIMVDGYGLNPTLSSTVFAVFAAAMTLGRFLGGPVVQRFGRAWVLGASALSAVIGISLVAFVDNSLVAGFAVVLWGLGASLGFPVAISSAGASGENPATRVAFVTVIGYVAFLVAPPLLGFIGERAGLRGALIIPLLVLFVSIFLSPVARTRPSSIQIGTP